jgi:hypothetical protein
MVIKMSLLLRIILFAVFVGIFVSCEETFIPDDTNFKEEIVVEGFVEASDQPLPVYVVLTKSFPFYASISQDQINDLFITGAEVIVNDGDKSVSLQEICLDQLPPEIKDELGAQFGFNLDSLEINFCIYLDILDQLTKEIGRSYELRVNALGQELTAITTIPEHVSLDSFYFKEPPGEPNDTLAELWTKISDPAGITNYYRYFTGANDGPLEIPFQSVTDDVFFDGQEFDFFLNKAENGDNVDFSTFGLFERGDSITIKWMTLDKEHYEFWSTLEFSRANQGPFASYTRVKSNINGGLGVFGGISASYYGLLVPE